MAEPRPPQSLAARVLVAVLLILLLGGVLVAGSTWWNGRQAARQSYDRLLLGAASDIAESIRIQAGQPLVDLPVSAFQLLAQAPEDRIFYQVRDAGGQFITGLDEDTTIDAPRPSGAAAEYFEAALSGEPARFVRIVRRFAERDYSGEIVVLVGQTMHARRAMTLELMTNALLPMAIAGLALLLMSGFVVRSALRPLDALSQDLIQRDPYDLTPMQTDRLPRELQVTIAAMNRFMERLDRQVDAMRNLISDTAHQLRTPVAAIRVQAETALDNEETRDRSLERLLARTRSLGTLLDQLLSRAMVIHRTDSAPRLPVDLREIALDIVERRDHEVLAPGIEVRLEIGDLPVTVKADPFSIGEAAKNLLGNALKHGQAPVSIGAERRGTCAVLWVRDGGTGPDDTVAERLGSRFNRDASSAEGNVGLGLSIVHSVAAAFGGRLDMTRQENGFEAALVLPTGPGEAQE